MFLKWQDEGPYDAGGSVIPAASQHAWWSSPPRGAVGEMSGAGLVAQYLESFKYRTDSVRSMTDSQLQKLYDKAVDLDEDLVDTPCEIPTLKSLMQACVDLQYVKKCSYKFFKSIDALKYYVADYGCCVVQLAFTDTTSNAHSFEISSAGTEISYDVTKGFIMFGYNANNVLLQNSLSATSGSLGFNTMSWNTFKKVFISAAGFTIT